MTKFTHFANFTALVASLLILFTNVIEANHEYKNEDDNEFIMNNVLVNLFYCYILCFAENASFIMKIFQYHFDINHEFDINFNYL